MLIKQKRLLSNFRQIAQEVNRLQSHDNQKENSVHQGPKIFTGTAMGVIMDMTRPLYRERDRDYIMEIKLMDQTINSSNIYGIMINKDRRELQVCNSIGQIIILDQFSFSLWNNIRLQTKFTCSIENLNCLQVKKGHVKQIGSLSSSRQKLTNLIQFEQRVFKIHSWFIQYFFREYHPLLGISLINSYCIMVEPFNMILKRVRNQQTSLDKEGSQDFTLEDAHKNMFFINKKDFGKYIPDSNYVYVRGITHIGNFYEITLSLTGNILGLPDNFQKFYEAEMNYCAVSRFNQKLLLRNHKTCQLSKLNYVSSKTTPVLQLLNNMQLYENKKGGNDDMRIENMYMIQAVSINFKGRLQLFHTEHQIIVHDQFVDSLSNQQRKQMIEQGKLAFLYEGVIGVLDRSSESKGQLLYVHLFSNQERTQFFDPVLINELNRNLGMLENNNLQIETKMKIQQKLENLIMRSDFTNTISMLLEPIKSDVLLYRLTNTIFI